MASGRRFLENEFVPETKVVVYKTDVKVVAKVWDENHEVWKRKAVGKAGVDDVSVVNKVSGYDSIKLACDLYGNFTLGGYIKLDGTIYGSLTVDRDYSKVVGNNNASSGAIINENQSAALNVWGRNCIIRDLYIKSKYNGIALSSPTGSLENRIENCKIVCIPSSAWTFGIVEDAANTDNYIVNNIINGFSGGILLSGGGSLAEANHIYRLPAEKFYRGIVVKAWSCRLTNNYIDNCSGVCFYIALSVKDLKIENNYCTIYTNNPGAFIEIADGKNPSNVIITGNICRSKVDGGSGFGINVANLQNSIIDKSNIFDNMNGVKWTENYDSVAITGDGTTTTFTIAHDLIAAPKFLMVEPQGNVPMPAMSADGTNITLTFSTAPASGTVYNYYWYARV